MKAIIVAGTHDGAGSTTISVAVMTCLRKQGLRVQAFKFGPEFSENNLLEAATGRMAVNLDPWNVPRDFLVSCVHRYGSECDVAVIDGSGGLFDRRSDTDQWSTAELARLLSAPVILVVDAGPLKHGAAAMVRGFEVFDKKIKVAGVVLNRVTSPDHASLLNKTLQKAGVKAQYLGFLTQNERVERSNDGTATYLDDLVKLTKNLNTSKFIEIANTAKVPKSYDEEMSGLSARDPTVKIAVAKDSAFSFYYHENFMMLEKAGAELVFFSPLQDERLPSDVSGVYLGGGRPELYAEELASNHSLLCSLKAFASAGGVIYAEGGGLLYLSKSVETADGCGPFPLAGVFPFRTRMSSEGSMVMGYVSVDMLNSNPLFVPGHQAKGHICHSSHVVQEIVRSAWGSMEGDDQMDYEYGYKLSGEIVKQGVVKEGYTTNAVLGSYVHIQFASNPRLAPSFVEKCSKVNLGFVQDAVSRALVKMSDRPSRRVSPFKRQATLEPSKFVAKTAEIFKISQEVSGGNRSAAVYSCEVNMNENPTAILQKAPKKELRKSSSTIELGSRLRCSRQSGNDKIVGMSTTGVEMICALGLGNRLVGVTNLCKYPADVQSGRACVAKTKFEASHLDDSRVELKLKDFWCRQESAFEIDEEFFRAQQPSLVIVEDGGDPSKDQLEGIFRKRRGSFTGLVPTAPTTILSHKICHLHDSLEFMLRIGEAAGAEEESTRIVDKFRARVAKIGTLVASGFPVEKVVVLTCLNPLMIGGYWIPEMVQLAGGEPLGAKAGHAPQRVTWQELKAMEPEVMILAAASWEETKQELAQLASLPGWWAVPAMKSGQLYVCEHKLFSTPGPRLIDGIELLARIMHPSSAGQYGKKDMAWSCTLRAGKRCRPCNLYKQFCALL